MGDLKTPPKTSARPPAQSYKDDRELNPIRWRLVLHPKLPPQVLLPNRCLVGYRLRPSRGRLTNV